jgi:CBS domain-containing protein
MRETLLRLKNCDVMNSDVAVVEHNSSVLDALEFKKQKHMGSVMITLEGRLCGIFTERDVLNRVLGGEPNLWELPVQEVMTPDPEVLHEDNSVAWALNRMAVGGFRHVPAVDDERRPVGMVSVRDIVEVIAGLFPEEIYNLPPEPTKFLPAHGG